MLRFLISLALMGMALATRGVDMSQATSQSAFSCMVSNGYTFTIARVYCSSGHPDSNGPTSINNAWKGGMKHVDGYIFPCPTCSTSPQQQVIDTINYLKANSLQIARREAHEESAPFTVMANSTVGSATVGMLWIDVEGTQYWTTSYSKNINFIQAMVDELNRQGVHFGIYTSSSQWSPITGNSAQFAKYPLWYPHYESPPNPSYSDWKAFGGWQTAAMKQYQGTTSACGGGWDYNYY